MNQQPTEGGSPAELIRHQIVLVDGPLRLRPLGEDDWDLLLKWNNDPDALHYSEGGGVTSWSRADLQDMYRSVSRTALMFTMELNQRPIGDCWLQPMNVDRIISRYPRLKLFRTPIVIGEKSLWGQGWGSRAIGLLTQHAFEQCRADAVFAVGVADYNPRSRRAFEKNGFVVDQEIVNPPGQKAKVEYDMVLTREAYAARRHGR